jgi:hypothetical protein
MLNDEAALVIEAACQPNGLTSGSDGMRTVACARSPRDGAPLVERVAAAEPQRPTPSRPQHAPRIDPARWPTVAADARLLRLRQAAWQHGVSHEAVRQIMRRLGGQSAPARPPIDPGAGAPSEPPRSRRRGAAVGGILPRVDGRWD